MSIEKILNKRSNAVVTEEGVDTPKKPTSSQLDNGEIAVNYHKGTERMFMKNDNDEVVEFVSKDEVDKKQDKVDGVNIVRKEFEDDYGPYTEGVVEVDNGVYNAMLRKDEIVFTSGSEKGKIIFAPKGHTVDGKYIPPGIKCQYKTGDDPFYNDLRIARMCDLPSVTPQVQSNWNETDNTEKSYINNKRETNIDSDSNIISENVHLEIPQRAYTKYADNPDTSFFNNDYYHIERNYPNDTHWTTLLYTDGIYLSQNAQFGAQGVDCGFKIIADTNCTLNFKVQPYSVSINPHYPAYVDDDAISNVTTRWYTKELNVGDEIVFFSNPINASGTGVTDTVALIISNMVATISKINVPTEQEISGKADKNEANIFTQKNTFPDIALSEEYALDYTECNIGDTLTTAYGDELTFKNNNTNNSVQLYNEVKNFAIGLANIEGVSNCIEISVPGNGELSFTGSTTAKLIQWVGTSDTTSIFVIENNGDIIKSINCAPDPARPAGQIISFMKTGSINVQAGIVKIYFSALYTSVAEKGWMWYISDISFSSTISSVKQAVNSKVDIVSLSPVATSGSYNDLSDTPSIPTNIVEQITINNNTITPTDGKIDLGTVLTSTTSSATSGSTTPITSGGVYKTLQSYLTTSSANSTYEKKMSFETVTDNLPNPCAVNKYYRIINPKTSLSIPLPTNNPYPTAGDTIGISFTAGSSITTPTVSGGTIYKQDGWSTFFEANATYEIVALYDGGKWLVTSTKFNS